jgi:outer membrane receptor protein involved in Fe transport
MTPETLLTKSGASAVYGADAVAGVVNIHLWKDFRGAQLSQYYGNTIQGTDAGLYKADILFGAPRYEAGRTFNSIRLVRADNVRTRLASCAVASLLAHYQRSTQPIRS